MTTQTDILTPKPRRDVRPLAASMLVLLMLVIGGLLQWWPMAGGSTAPEPLAQVPAANKGGDHPTFKRTDTPASAQPQQPAEAVWTAPPAPIDPQQDPRGHLQQARSQEAETRFQQSRLMLHAGQFDEAIVALNRILTLLPDNPDVYTNLGYALIGKGIYAAAFAAFDRATDLNPTQTNAYYGAAIALEGMGDLEGALSGMRSFLHLTDKGPGQIHVARARSAIWEWESQLARGPWGPTQGIPPGFTRDELKRDNQGVGIKMPIAGTADENGLFQYEIKHQDKFELFDR